MDTIGKKINNMISEVLLKLKNIKKGLVKRYINKDAIITHVGSCTHFLIKDKLNPWKLFFLVSSYKLSLKNANKEILPSFFAVLTITRNVITYQ